MTFGLRAALRWLFVVFIALSAVSGAEAREPKGVPKSAPAFTKFMAEFIHEAMPQAKIAIAGRLRLDVEMPSGKKTADLHETFNACHRDPDDCPQATTEYVAAVVLAFKPPSAQPSPPASRADLRIIVRSAAYVDAIRRNRPVAAPLAADLWLLVVKDEGEKVEILTEDDLPALAMTSQSAFAAASENTRPWSESVVRDLAKKRCAGILGGDYYITSTVASADIWAPVAHRCHDNLIVAVPDTGSVVYGDASSAKDGLSYVQSAANKLLATADKPVSATVLRWTAKGWVPVPPRN
ncbi:MAG TPA: hypothetical protein VMU22_10205 [Rhizomicrobium sp.]|nr:hypothetical protein [Rhizomicrobium sp.]